jgi:vacuolar-type H+-ATPase subunit I/STV1
VFGRRESLRELVHNLHEENLRYQEKREEESRRREERLERLEEETREFNREILLRNEKVYTSVLARLEEMGKEIQENTERTRAGTQAILRLLDRFDEPGGATA